MRYTTTLLLSLMLVGCTVHSTADNSRTFFVNGLASASPNIGYGIRNLYEKHGKGAYYAYSSTYSGFSHVNDIIAAIEKNPHNVRLIGMSYGARVIHAVATELNRRGIKIQYVAVVDGVKTKPWPDNIRKLDNFYCIGCVGGPVSVAKNTHYKEFSYPGTHVAFANDHKVHSRILSQL